MVTVLSERGSWLPAGLQVTEAVTNQHPEHSLRERTAFFLLRLESKRHCPQRCTPCRFEFCRLLSQFTIRGNIIALQIPILPAHDT